MTAFRSPKRKERGREVKNLHCPATVKGTKAITVKSETLIVEEE
jgi:hypothetical protein